jgi:hypothetical protein
LLWGDYARTAGRRKKPFPLLGPEHGLGLS